MGSGDMKECKGARLSEEWVDTGLPWVGTQGVAALALKNDDMGSHSRQRNGTQILNLHLLDSSHKVFPAHVLARASTLPVGRMGRWKLRRSVGR